ncbi:B-cell receptor CD22-like isoform X2 [Gadus chalcogrammus]|uniref:B-cell receptor CD22-like isoform X2 n=1 Tax=Gadus chalcogrammus TaxID=1042646 RepID=UPI0024C38864|nr:B-cell receptor CD22-like isoform X2 [Gadus chalcogrammus]
MTLRSAARGFLAFLLSVQALRGNGDLRVTYSSSNVCALRGAMVLIHCTYEYPVIVPYRPTRVRTLWFTEGDNYQALDLEPNGVSVYTGRIEYSCGEVGCTGSRCHGTCALKIRDLRRSDSAVYKFRFTTNQPGVEHTGEPGVKLSVTDPDLQVKVSFPYPTIPTWTKLECHSRCGLAGDPPYIWFRNGQNAGQGVNNRVVTQFGDIYSCAVQGFSPHSPSVYAPKTPSVTVRPSGELEEGSSVTLSCSSDANPAANYTWFKVINQRYYRHMNQGPQVIFRSILSTDSGQYCCIAQTELRTSKLIYIYVKYRPKHTSVYSSPSGGIKEDSSVTLSCSTDANPAADYTWFKNNQPLPWGPSRRHTFPSVRPEDSGTYRCHAENKYGQLSSNSTFMDVQYAPKNLSVTVRPSGELEEGSSVTLSCSSDANPAANYTWFKEHAVSVEESGQTYTITRITLEHAGNYSCQAHNAIGLHNSTFLLIKVTSSSSQTMAALTTIGVLLAIILLLVILWTRKGASRKACGQGGRPDTVLEPLPGPVYENVSALTNRSAPAAQREPIEEQDDLHYASIHTSRSKNQEVLRCRAGSRVQSDQADAVFYSVVNIKTPNAAPGETDQTEAADPSALYSTVKKHPRV